MNSTRIPILNDDYKVVVCWGEYKQVSKVLKRYYYFDEDLEHMAEDFYGILRGICFHRRGLIPVICLPNFPETPEEIATLAHEACHAVEYIFGCINATDEEVFAHSVGAIVRNTLTLKDKING